MVRCSQELLQKVSRIESLNDHPHCARHPLDCFNDRRIALENPRLSERYFDGEIHLRLHLRFVENVQYVASFQVDLGRDARLEKSIVIMRGDVLHSRELSPNVCDTLWSRATRPILRSDSEQESVLVKVVQPMHLPNVVSSASRVCFDLIEPFYSGRLKALFYSPNSGFKFPGSITHRKVDLVERPEGISSKADQPIQQMIQSTSEIVDSIPGKEINVAGNRGRVGQATDVLSGIRIAVGLDRIVVFTELVPEFIEIEDLLFGPF